MKQDRTQPKPAGGTPVKQPVGRPVPTREELPEFVQCQACADYDPDATCPQCPGRVKPSGLLAQIEACRREVAQWPAHMRVVATLRMHAAAMDGADL